VFGGTKEDSRKLEFRDRDAGESIGAREGRAGTDQVRDSRTKVRAKGGGLEGN
jgi:hypothetical protein